MRQLSDILIEKIKKVGGKAELGRLLGGLSGQAIGQYINGATPSFEIAVKWREAFGENLISLMYDEKPSLAEEPSEQYGLRNDIETLRKIVDRLEKRMQAIKTNSK